MLGNDFFKKLFAPENKKLKSNLIAIFLIGVLLIISGNTLFKGSSGDEIEPNIVEQANELAEQASLETDSTEKLLEKRLESILSNIDGAGQVKVMVSLSQGSEISVAEETKKDSSVSGGTSESSNNSTESFENKIVILETQKGDQQPLILKESAPKVEGILVICEGGDDVFVKEGISNACQALFNVPAHKIEILKMK